MVSDMQPELVPAGDLPWVRLLAYLPALGDPASDPGGWSEARQTESGAVHMPYAIWPDVLEEFVQTLYSEGFIGAFDWRQWAHGEGERFMQDHEALSRASLDDLRRVLISHVRADRFNEGHLLAEYRAGTLAVILRRAEELLNEQSSS